MAINPDDKEAVPAASYDLEADDDDVLPFQQLPHAWCRAPGISNGAFRLYILLRSYTNAGKPVVFPSSTTLAKSMGLSAENGQRQVRRLFGELITAACVSITHRPGTTSLVRVIAPQKHPHYVTYLQSSGLVALRPGMSTGVQGDSPSAPPRTKMSALDIRGGTKMSAPPRTKMSAPPRTKMSGEEETIEEEPVEGNVSYSLRSHDTARHVDLDTGEIASVLDILAELKPEIDRSTKTCLAVAEVIEKSPAIDPISVTRSYVDWQLGEREALASWSPATKQKKPALKTAHVAAWRDAMNRKAREDNPGPQYIRKERLVFHENGHVAASKPQVEHPSSGCPLWDELLVTMEILAARKNLPMRDVKNTQFRNLVLHSGTDTVIRLSKMGKGGTPITQFYIESWPPCIEDVARNKLRKKVKVEWVD